MPIPPDSSRRGLLKAAALTGLAGLAAAQPLSAEAAPRHADREFELNVFDFGAKGDGKADDTAAIQAALDEAGKAGGMVVLPAKTYRVEGNLNVPNSVCLQGVFETPPSIGGGNRGSKLLALAGKGSETGPAFITLSGNGTLRGVAVFYPEQTSDIIPYPATVQSNGDNCTIENVLLVNPFFGVDFGNRSGRHYIKSLYMQALSRGIYVAECFDIGRIEDVHIWPFWNPTDEKARAYTKAHGEAFVLARTDWEYMVNCFCIGYKTGYRFTTSHSGPGNVTLTQCGSDEGPESTSVLVEACQGHAGVSFVNSQFMGQRQVQVMPTNNGPVKFTACGFWGMPKITDSIAQLQGTGQVTFNGCHFINWAMADNATAPAIDAQAGGLTISVCDFMDEGKQQVRIASGVKSAIVSSSRLRGGQKIENDIGEATQMGLNTVV